MKSFLLIFILVSCVSTDETKPTGNKNPSPYVPAETSVEIDGDYYAYEFKNFSFDGTSILSGLDGAKTYSYSGINLPGWANINMVTGEVTGMPMANLTHSNIKIIATNILDSNDKIESDYFSIGVNGDPLRFAQWHLNNTGQSTFANNSGTAGFDVNLLQVYTQDITGQGVKIAVSDSGVELNHGDLQSNVLENQSRDYTLPSPYIGFPTPSTSHGTSVAGLIAAVGWNNLGVTGVAPSAQFAGFQFLSSSQSNSIMISQASGDFDIFNYSYGDTLLFDTISNANYIDHLRFENANGRSNKGTIYVKSAGNEFIMADNPSNPSVCAPHNANLPFENESPFVILAGAINADGRKAQYSNAGSNIWVSAPGGDYGDSYPAILTTDLPTCLKGKSKAATGLVNAFEYGHQLNKDCDYTSSMNGTSAAAPILSGAIALLLDANPALSQRDVKHILAVTAEKIDQSNFSFSRTNHPSNYLSACPSLNLSGHDYELGWQTNNRGISFNNFYGFGLVDINKAVELALDFTKDPLSALPLGALVESNPDFDEANLEKTGLSLAVPDNDSSGVTDTLVISGATTFLESIQVKVAATHTRSGDLGVELTSPQGTKSILLNINNSLLLDGDQNLNIVLTSHAFYGENPNGTWTIKIIDGQSGNTGTLTSWRVNLFGHN